MKTITTVTQLLPYIGFGVPRLIALRVNFRSLLSRTIFSIAKLPKMRVRQTTGRSRWPDLRRSQKHSF